jgi:hypothetical protein
LIVTTWNRVVAPAMLAVLLLGCSAAPAIPIPSSIPIVGQVNDMLSWLREHTLACDGPADAGNGQLKWTCEHDDDFGSSAPDKTVYRVVLIAGLNGLGEVRAVVDQSADRKPEIDRARGFLADTIGAAGVLGKDAQKISKWVATHLKDGGTTTFAPVKLTLTPFGKVTRLTLTFAG